MYKVALVQNQSEMSHYGYADARPILEEFGYKPILYTAQNIDELTTDLLRQKFDAIIFASNALNDKTIRENVLSDKFVKTFGRFLKKGNGCLVLHQLRMAQERISLKFLPNPLNVITPEVRKEKEKASDGEFYLTAIGKQHACFLYPYSVDINNVKQRCLNFKSLKGLYWHYWKKINESDWNVLLYDKDENNLNRPLIISSKEFESFRIVISSLTLDWQKQKRVLQNILNYVVEGKHDTAILKDTRNTSAGFEYLIESLKSIKYPFRIYDVNQNLNELKRNIKNSIHTIIVLDPYVNEEKIDLKMGNVIKKYVNGGKIKLIKLTQDTDLKIFYIAGREKFALRILHNMEIKVQNELADGYLDGSFWSTVESLQILNDMISYLRSEYDSDMLRKVIEISNPHDRYGSYDEVFGVSCALLWLRAKYLGIQHPDTQRTLQWIRNALNEYEDREKVLAYHTLLDINIITESEKGTLKRLLLSQQDKLDRLSEIDLIVYLKASIKINVIDVIVPIIRSLSSTQNNGYWVDLETTATATVALIDSLKLLQKRNPSAYVKIRKELESMIFKSIIYIQNSIERLSEDTPYPWDNKASTSLKCIQAWLKFEEMIDLPINEIIDVLKSYSGLEKAKSSTKISLTILNDLRNQNNRLTHQYSGILSKMKKYKRSQKLNLYLTVAFLSSAYVLLSITIYSLIRGASISVGEVIKGAFIYAWPFHLAFLTLIFSLFGILIAWKRRSDGGA